MEDELKSKQAELAQVILQQESKLGQRPALATTSRVSYQRMRLGKGNPTLRSLMDVARPLGFEVKFVPKS